MGRLLKFGLREIPLFSHYKQASRKYTFAQHKGALLFFITAVPSETLCGSRFSDNRTVIHVPTKRQKISSVEFLVLIIRDSRKAVALHAFDDAIRSGAPVAALRTGAARNRAHITLILC